MSQTNELLTKRYGGASTTPKPLTIVLASALLAIFFGFAIYASFFAEPPASVKVSSYKQLDENHIQANFTAYTGNKPAACVFKAYTAEGVIVGFIEVQIPPNNDDTRALSVVLKTVVGADVLKADGCSVK